MDKPTPTEIGIILIMIAGFSTIPFIDTNTGSEMEPTHYCESIGIKMYCARTTAQYCYPSNETRSGSKKCSEGWKVIPEYQYNEPNSDNRLICTAKPKECKMQ